MFAYHVWHVRRKDDLESLLGDVPAHHLFGPTKERRFAAKDLRTSGLAFAAGDNHRRGAIPEEPGRDEIGNGEVVPLPGQGTQFDRDQDRVMVGERTHVIRSASDTRGTGNASETEDRGSFDVRAQI